jgi:hypothetical protein
MKKWLLIPLTMVVMGCTYRDFIPSEGFGNPYSGQRPDPTPPQNTCNPCPDPEYPYQHGDRCFNAYT